jgi:hypothetical protein
VGDEERAILQRLYDIRLDFFKTAKNPDALLLTKLVELTA